MRRTRTTRPTSPTAAMLQNIRSGERVDPLTVGPLERPYAPFLANLAMVPASIVSPRR